MAVAPPALSTAPCGKALAQRQDVDLGDRWASSVIERRATCVSGKVVSLRMGKTREAPDRAGSLEHGPIRFEVRREPLSVWFLRAQGVVRFYRGLRLQRSKNFRIHPAGSSRRRALRKKFLFRRAALFRNESPPPGGQMMSQRKESRGQDLSCTRHRTQPSAPTRRTPCSPRGSARRPWAIPRSRRPFRAPPRRRPPTAPPTPNRRGSARLRTHGPRREAPRRRPRHPIRRGLPDTQGVERGVDHTICPGDVERGRRAAIAAAS